MFDPPHPDRSFGSVVCADVLQHLPELDRPVAEMLRVAREHVFLLHWLRKADVPGRAPELVTVEVPEHGAQARFYEHAWSDAEVIAACRAAGGRVLDFQVVDGEGHDLGLVRMEARR